MARLVLVVAAIIWNTPACAVENVVQLSEGETAYSAEQSISGIAAVIIAAGIAISSVLLIIACASLCPHQSNNYQEDAFFGDIRIGAPPVVEFGMYPPVESTPSSVTANSGGRIVFEPLPDIASMRRRLTLGSAKEEVDAIGRKLRPRVGRMERERTESGDSLNEVDDTAEKLKLDHVLANSRQQFPRAHLQYIRELGSSWFGKVLQGEGQGILPGHKKTKVVIQILNEEAEQSSQLVFLREGQPYREIDHANVIRLLGQCVETIPYLSIYEYCSLGDLKTYLKSHRGSVETLDRQGLILNFTCDIAAGLQALHQQYFIHRDLALRNCLLTADMIVKVGDYGLAEETFKDDYYHSERSDVGIPIRWLAPEVIQVETSTNNTRSIAGVVLRTVTKDSNIWSFGVTLWELVTFGAQPYSDLSNEHVLRLVVLERSVRLSRPEAPVSHLDRLYELMQMCWLEAPTRRPSLRELRIMLLHLRSSRDQADTSAFDIKWNQLKPRQPVEPVPTVDIQHFEAQDGGRLSDRGSNSTVVTVHRAGAGFDLRSDFGAARPTSFESDFSSLNASLLAQAGSRQTSLRSVSGTPDSPLTFCGSSISAPGGELTSPINELSLAAEIGASQRLRGDSSIGDDDSVGNWIEREEDGDLGLGARSAGNWFGGRVSGGAVVVNNAGVPATTSNTAGNLSIATVAAANNANATVKVNATSATTDANAINDNATSATVTANAISNATVSNAIDVSAAITGGPSIVATSISKTNKESAGSVPKPAPVVENVSTGAMPASKTNAQVAAASVGSLPNTAVAVETTVSNANSADLSTTTSASIPVTTKATATDNSAEAAVAVIDDAIAVAAKLSAEKEIECLDIKNKSPVADDSLLTNIFGDVNKTSSENNDDILLENVKILNGNDFGVIPHEDIESASAEMVHKNYRSTAIAASNGNSDDIVQSNETGYTLLNSDELNNSQLLFTKAQQDCKDDIFQETSAKSGMENSNEQPSLLENVAVSLSEGAGNKIPEDEENDTKFSAEQSFPADSGATWSVDSRISSDSSSVASLATPPVSLERSRTNYSAYLQTVTTSLDSESSDFSDDIPASLGKMFPNSLPAVDEYATLDELTGEIGIKPGLNLVKDDTNGDFPDNVDESSENIKDLPAVSESEVKVGESFLEFSADEPNSHLIEKGLKDNPSLFLADEKHANSPQNGPPANSTLQLADEMERITLGEEFLGDDTEFGRFYEKSLRVETSETGNGDIDLSGTRTMT